MSQITLKQSRVINLNLPRGYDLEKIQIGIPASNQNKRKLGNIESKNKIRVT